MKENPLLHRHDEYKVKTRDVRVVRLLIVLVALASLYTLYFAQSLIIPVVFSMLVALLLSPLVTRFKRLYIPRAVSSMVLLTMLITPLTFLAFELSEPAERWMKSLPLLAEEIAEELSVISSVVQGDTTLQENQANNTAYPWFEKEPTQKTEDSAVEEQFKQGSRQMIFEMLLAAPLFLAQVIGAVVLTLFLLIFGPPLSKVVINDFPIIKDRKRARLLIRSIQQALSNYILTISIINCALGVLTAIGLSYFNIRDAILWGAIVGLLNFVPYMGSIISVGILLLVGTLQFGLISTALLPVGIFLTLNIIESQIVTPTVLGKSMQINPLVIIVWLFLSGWIWGMLGVLLAVPIFVCIKLTLQQMEVFPHWLKFIEAHD
ncbi:AI-2E family transporter [Alteromonas sp. BMJM2]|uniref:AI-2E family transporter n=1 Tax=Alteromonas sp. BMJM2 TaxID=2954241 RepID=UPI0022B3C8D5|nr:AI-2E family transporter [Alteromonas sp. BMJM2]